jgi:hypothetical protein
MVAQRACEIARIEGRSPDNITPDDRVRAERELQGNSAPLSTEDVASEAAASRDPADPTVDTGHAVREVKPADEQELNEDAATEGVREADHDRMLEGERRSREKQE